MNSEFEYYLIGSDYKPTTPLLRSVDGQSLRFLHKVEPVEEFDEPIRLCFNKPYPKKVIMTDYHSLPESVVSPKISDVLKPMDIYGIQLLPAEIRNNKTNEIYPDYHLIFVYNRIRCLDMKNAIYTIEEDEDAIESITKLVLDKEILSKIPLEKRLIFLLSEASSMEIYHKSVVDAVLAANPEGVVFKPIEEWFEGVQFEKD